MLDLDEIIFKRLARFHKRRKNTLSESEEARVVHLSNIQQQLTLLARALTGVAIDVIPAEREGGFKGMHFLVPRRMLLFSDANLNDLYYRFRVMYMSVQWEQQTPNEDLDVLGQLLEEYPALKDIHAELKKELTFHFESQKQPIDESWLTGHVYSELISEPDLTASSNVPSQRKANSAQTEIKAKHADEVESIQVDKKAQEDYVFTHNFEKVETAEEFDGSWRDFDGSDELDEHSEALNELSLKNTVRVDEETHSVYQSDFVANTKVAESAEMEEQEVVCTYPEWDRAKNAYRPDFCKVHIWPCKRTNDAYVIKALKDNGITLRALRKMFARFFNDLETVRHLQQGEELDTDALTDLVADG